MSINREAMLKKLENVAPALADHDLVPIYTHLLFDGEKVLAYNDRIALSTPLKTNFKGTVPGKDLIEMVRIAAHTDKVELHKVNNNVQLGAKEAKTKLETRAVTDFRFTMPSMPKSAAIIKEDFFTAVEDCLQAIIDKATRPDHLGITFIPSGKELKLFATTGNTMAYCKIPAPANLGLKERLILPSQFCRELLRLQKETETHKLVIHDGYALFSADDNLLFTRVVQSEQPLDFEGTLKRLSESSKKPIRLNGDLRPRLKIALEMAARICNDQRTSIKVQNNAAEFSSLSDRGQQFDKISLKHPNVETAFHAETMVKVYDRYESLSISPDVALMSRDNNNSIFLLACFSAKA